MTDIYRISLTGKRITKTKSGRYKVETNKNYHITLEDLEKRVEDCLKDEESIFSNFIDLKLKPRKTGKQHRF
jgi:hypothetical protein